MCLLSLLFVQSGLDGFLFNLHALLKEHMFSSFLLFTVIILFKKKVLGVGCGGGSKNLKELYMFQCASFSSVISFIIILQVIGSLLFDFLLFFLISFTAPPYQLSLTFPDLCPPLWTSEKFKGKECVIYLQENTHSVVTM